MSKEIIVIFNNIASYNKDQYLLLILSLLISYLIGSISPSTIISKYKGIDIKNSGSGNAGTTNVLRLLGIKAAVITLGIDIIKGMIAVKVGMGLVDFNTAALCSIAVVLGHIFPIFYKFKGGKGVATAFGAVLMINWPSALAALILVILTVGISKKMSLGSLIGAISYPLLILFYFPRFFIFGSILALTLVLTHISNIKRLIKKEEKAISVANPEGTKDIKDIKDSNNIKELKEDSELNKEVNKNNKEDSIAKATDESSKKTNDEDIPKDYFDERAVPNLKPKDKRKIAFIGINKYLLSLANIMAYNGHNVMVFGEDRELISKLRDTNILEEEFPDILLSSKIQYTYHIMTAVNKRHIIVINGSYEKLKDLLSKLSKKADKNTLIINLIDNKNNDCKNISEKEVKKIMKDNPYLELSYNGDYMDLIMNRKADLFVIKDDGENINEVIKTLGSQKINIISKEVGSKN